MRGDSERSSATLQVVSEGINAMSERLGIAARYLQLHPEKALDFDDAEQDLFIAYCNDFVTAGDVLAEFIANYAIPLEIHVPQVGTNSGEVH